jgi:peptide/nickel transport system substrate-binding protein
MRRMLLLLCVLASASCGVPISLEPRADASSAAAADQGRTLIMASGSEVQSLAPKVMGQVNASRTTRLFNAALALIDGSGRPRPYLAEALPEFGTDTWRVVAGGRMETVWRLRPNLTWHDGTPLTAQDFVFAWRVYSAGLGVFLPTPQDIIEDVAAVDPQTLSIRWATMYPDANAVVLEQLDPLPRHLLLADFEALREGPQNRDAFLRRTFWTTEYVGAGPFRLSRWDAGVQLQGEAFDGHALGRVKIDRVIVRIMPDDSAVAAAVLSGQVHFTVDHALRIEQALVLKREWASSGGGVVIYTPAYTHVVAVQLRPDFLRVPALRDLRVRRALASTFDKQSLVDSLFDGEGRLAETFIGPEHAFFAQIDPSVTKYPYDPTRAEELMVTAGFRRGADGVFVKENGEQFAPAFWTTPSAQAERLQSTLVTEWRRNGYDVHPQIIPQEKARDNQLRSTFPGLLAYGVSPNVLDAFESFTIAQIGEPENRWSGQNRGGWNNPQYDRLIDTLHTTVEREQRIAQLGELAHTLSEELPVYPLLLSLGAITHVASLTGPEPGVREATDYWNIQNWTFN